mmetsp:Transcript_597/g.1530  ORF Transcript_597/g.1530 Transcript_597/m.1530 type:complete len:376 (+) Transcript_597:202-1329(+)|eukprot:CAMPEP_0171537944 /NCGR_PEP_ID=MMETSP0959-20130129/18831_1 /TAXON_ID=87120 /ORGANISM="Aurantiochytrium limacinum, Strain ATCCMYA-1381" /LENGTH=375 /DNA_ID=CAMNT_0012084737 /DNA_START=100 /DNA_END=1227 /DNA_ORIENTATION=-
MFEPVLAFGVGSVFGLVLDKAHNNIPASIITQMNMTNFTMMRMFLAASSASALVILALHKLGIKERSSKGGLALGFNLFGGYGANLVGGMVLGVGLYLSGACPGTVFAMLGANVPYAWLTFVGGIVGTVLFGYMDKHIRASNEKFHVRHEPATSDLALKLGVPFEVASVGFLAVCLGGLVAFDKYMPWEDGQAQLIAKPDHGRPLFDLTAKSWDPMVCGFLLGMLQLPVKLFTGYAIGQSSGYVKIASQVTNFIDSNLHINSPYLHRSLNDKYDAFQVFSGLGIMFGAALSNYLAGEPDLTSLAANGCGGPVRAFIGGVVMLLGARFAGGCASGHGISGMATLSAGSVVSVCGMFMGGILCSLIEGNFMQPLTVL